MEQALLLMTISASEQSVASILRNADTEAKERCEVMQLMTQVAELTEQVAALTARQTPICFSCNVSGIVLTNAVTSQLLIDDVTGVVERATFKWTAGCRETTRGHPGRATSVPSSRPR